MDLAAERFATLHSEEALDRMPEPIGTGLGEADSGPADVLSTVQPPVTRPEARGDADRSSASAATGARAFPVSAPLA